MGSSRQSSPDYRDEVDDGTSLPRRCLFTRNLKRSGLYNLGNTDSGNKRTFLTLEKLFLTLIKLPNVSHPVEHSIKLRHHRYHTYSKKICNATECHDCNPSKDSKVTLEVLHYLVLNANHIYKITTQLAMSKWSRHRNLSH